MSNTDMPNSPSILNSQQVLAQSGIAFGTSGARGLVSQFSDDVCAAFALAFVHGIKNEFNFDTVAIGIDNRPSSPQMAQATIVALENIGLKTIYCGVLPTPALAYYAMGQSIPCIMITGSHIPFDRNGIKFYRPDGEITKQDESAILNAQVNFTAIADITDINLSQSIDNAAVQAYTKRYLSLFDNKVLQGLKIGIYEHSSAGRDIYKALFEQLGAEVTSLERSDTFVPIDTEAVSEQDRQKARDWQVNYDFDLIFSTDGDGDRPLVADETGEWLRGDILCLLAAKLLGIEKLAVPVSCNTAIEKSNNFNQVVRTKIGSPYVIEAFSTELNLTGKIAGFEANGGFLLGTDVEYQGQTLTALPTRDALLPALLVAVAANRMGGLSKLLQQLPARFTASDRIKDFATARSQQIIAECQVAPDKLLNLLNLPSSLVSVDTTDGFRMTFTNDDILHLRPSGNAPELRCYAESNSIEQAESLVKHTLCKILEYK